MPIKIFNPPIKITLKVKSVQILTGRGPDKISLNFDNSVPFPFEAFPESGSAEITTQAGYGLAWCKKVFKLKESDIEVITMPKFKSNFSGAFGSKPKS